jgi:predicted enzyme involved in methoxymalonyl-ACP biosynthesis
MGLDLRLQLRRATEGDRPRILELLARSHQLRLTGDDALPVDLSEVYVLFARDRLADHGLVGVAWRGPGPGAPWAELAVSCRVLPQRVAGSALAALRALAPEAAVPYRPTGRNGAAAGLIAESADGIAPWVRLDGPAGATG